MVKHVDPVVLEVFDSAVKPIAHWTTPTGVSVPLFACAFGESCVDATNWRPDSDMVRNRLLSGNLGSSMVPQYDFDDGKDTGYRPFRQLGADITEVDAAMQAIKDAKAKSDAEKEQKQQAISDLSEAMQTALGLNTDDSSEVSES